MKTSHARIALALLMLSLVCCQLDLPTDWLTFEPSQSPPATESAPTAPPSTESAPSPTLSPGSTAGVAAETEQLLEETVVPVRDLHELAIRLSGLPPDTSRTINPEGPPDYPVGTRRIFNVSNMDTDEQFNITAILEYKTDHVYMWIEQGAQFDPDELGRAAERFEEHIYPTDRSFFGSEWTPGVDNDPHVSILHAHGLGSVGGYYSSADEFVSAVREDSNQMEMFYISLDYMVINSNDYHGVLAHEFQHMIHWYNDRNEQTWLNEGFSELASYLNGFDPGQADQLFAHQPDNQLSDIDYDAPDGFASYGAAYLFTSYFLDRFGREATQALVNHQENGLSSVDEVLTGLGAGITHEDLFADWVVANMLDDPALDGGRFGYNDIDPPEFQMDNRFNAAAYPVLQETTVRQYGTDYVEVEAKQPLLFSFTGSTQIGLVNTTAHSGQYLWWSNREDDSDTTLTRAFDLSGVDSATLEFWTWYDIEENWDYAYVEVSLDGGQTWEILTTPSGTDTNPNGNSFGWAYTGTSGGGDEPAWIQERVDLSPYAGQEVLVRFEYITDDAVNRPGFVLDDIAIPEIDYASDFEADNDGWEAAGFVRHANVLPQRWLVQLITFGPETTVQRLELSEDQSGQWEIPLSDGGADRAVVAVSALAPVTTELASYRYEITPR